MIIYRKRQINPFIKNNMTWKEKLSNMASYWQKVKMATIKRVKMSEKMKTF